MPGASINTEKYIVYIPPSIDMAKKYPVVVCFDPGGNADWLVEYWHTIADKYNLIILASKEFRNEINPGPAFNTVIDVVRNEFYRYAIDKQHVIAAGNSGGGMAAHMIAAGDPEIIWAVISNCGTIHPDFIRDNEADYPRDKIAVFISGTEDFNRERMLKDRVFLDRHGWKTKWINFTGGHRMAPQDSFDQAIAWLRNSGDALLND